MGIEGQWSSGCCQSFYLIDNLPFNDCYSHLTLFKHFSIHADNNGGIIVVWAWHHSFSCIRRWVLQTVDVYICSCRNNSVMRALRNWMSFVDFIKLTAHSTSVDCPSQIKYGSLKSDMSDYLFRALSLFTIVSSFLFSCSSSQSSISKYSSTRLPTVLPNNLILLSYIERW